jgi:hypothetical protein
VKESASATAESRINLVTLPDGSIAMKRLVISKEEGIFKLARLSDNPTCTPFELEIEPARRLENHILGRVRRVGEEFD